VEYFYYEKECSYTATARPKTEEYRQGHDGTNSKGSTECQSEKDRV
jgi:hypothetical protein